uniref:AB hydrolase-1 domain-containing protein n=1 Tax=Neobodo designis TaxID=312471 RepID=A0A7S1Q5M6_NEODS|mmetsp:Transcript_34110/g.105415  ORF Transcript_34110/g.105415 Transcript_34110/m.105415 type:complete len:479 (+) Transcript_34110:149-1585(+)
MSIIELATCVASGDATGVHRVLENATDVKALLEGKVGLKGATLLHMAASHGYPDVVAELLEFGADPNALDGDRLAPLGYVPEGHEKAEETREALVSRGAVDDAAYFTHSQPASNTEQQASYISKSFLRSVFVVFLLPFIVLLVWNGPWFCFCFVTTTTLFYFIAVGFFVTEITLRPPWYHATPGAKELGMVKLPEEWRDKVHDPKVNFKIDFENVEFQTTHGAYTLRGWYVPGKKDVAKPPKTSIVFLHGGGRDRRTWLRHLPMFHKRGYNCLLFDFREHGCSDGAMRGLTFGMKERYDALAACRFMKHVKKHDRVALVGTSVGGSTAIMAAALDAKLVDLVVSENPMLTCAHLQREHIANVLGGYFRHTKWGNFVFALFQRCCSSWLNLRVGNKPSKSCQAFHSVSKIGPRPLLLMHGTYDSTIPFEHSKKLFELAKAPKELWIAPGGCHVGLYDAFPEEFERRMFHFLGKYDAYAV